MMLYKRCTRVGITLTFANYQKVGKESRYNNSMKVTPNQVKNLLNNAFGFYDKYGTIYHYDNDLSHDEWFQLIDNRDGDIEIFEYADAEICNGTLSVHYRNSEVFEQFTILVVATDGSNLLPQLLEE